METKEKSRLKVGLYSKSSNEPLLRFPFLLFPGPVPEILGVENRRVFR